MMIAPCARKMSRMVPKMRLSPTAATPYMAPPSAPLTVSCNRISGEGKSDMALLQHAHIGFLDLGIGQEIGARALHDHLARVEHEGVIRDLQGLMDVLLDQKNR